MQPYLIFYKSKWILYQLRLWKMDLTIYFLRDNYDYSDNIKK